jgi:hypothetical protein
LDVNAYCYVKEELPLPYLLMLDGIRKILQHSECNHSWVMTKTWVIDDTITG